MEESETGDAPEEVAIVGMTGRFPGASDTKTFWENLRNGRETITRFPKGTGPYQDNSDYVPARGVIEDPYGFDAAFFGIHPNEALITDPQQRVFLECAWEALETAGYDPQTFKGAIGVYAGMTNNTYFSGAVAHHPELIDAVGAMTAMLGNEKDFLATRVAYKLDLKGPAISINTACSTSLVAVSQAVSSLLSYQCDMALAGGISLTFPAEQGYVYHEGGITSPDGHCRAYDEKAQGTVFSAGAGVVVLKRLSEAIADGDTILAVIKGTALNNDGANKVSFTAPSVSGHAEVISMAHTIAGVDPRSISYIEGHGTGTPLGDPIELAGLTEAFRMGTEDTNFCALGSVKPNIGHLDTAAGVAGLIKTVLALQHSEIPPTIHFEVPNPKLDLENSPFFINREVIAWEGDSEPRRAGVSSFGVGGTNAHVIVEEAPALEPTDDTAAPQLLVISARTATALDAATANLAAYLEGEDAAPLADAAYTLSLGRQHFAHRRFVIAENAADAATALGANDAKRVFTGKVDARSAAAPEVAFLFPGQGVQQVNMGRDLYETEAVFKDAIDESCALLRPHLGFDLRDVLYPTPGGEADAQQRLTQTFITQPSLFVVEYALAQQWMAWGVKPAAMFGHSVGEYVAACLSGVFSLEDGLTLLAARARLMQDLPGGSMLAVRLSEEELRPRLPKTVSIAAINSPSLCMVSGSTEEIVAFEQQLSADKITSRRLPTSHAFHSAMMEPVLPKFGERLRAVCFEAPQIPYVSSLTGRFIRAEQATDPEYWLRQLREAVRFTDGVQTLLENPNRVLLEVGPGQTLSTLVRQSAPRGSTNSIIASLPASGSTRTETVTMREAIGHLWRSGVGVDFAALYAGQVRRRVPLPTYPFEHKVFRLEPKETTMPNPSPVSETAPVASEAATAPVGRVMRLQAELQTALSELSGFALEDLAPEVTFLEMGFDSLFLTQVAQNLQGKWGVKITFRQLIETHPTIADLAKYLDAKLPAEAKPAAPAPQPAPVVPQAVEPAPVAVAPPIVAPAPAAAPQYVAVAAPVGESAIERLMSQQLQLMQQQIELLRGAPAGVVVPAPIATPTAPASVVAAPSVTAATVPVAPKPAPAVAPAQKPEPSAEPVKVHGPYRPMQKTSAAMTAEQEAALNSLMHRYTERTAASKAMTQKDRAHLADPRVVSGFRQAWKEMVYPIVTDRSEGARLFDIDGNEYVDVTLGFGTNFLGHRPPFVVAEVQEQLTKGIEIGPQSLLAGRVAEKICRMTGMERAAFCCTGSEAVTAALRVARTVTGRSLIAFFGGAYHGQFDEVLARPAMGKDAQSRALPVAPGIQGSMTENVLLLEYGSDEALQVLRERGHEIAVVLVEPVQSRNPDLQPEAFVREVRRITEETGTALLFDEVVTGFRTHPGGMQARWGIRADMATYGKVVGGGIPIGVLTGSAKFLDALDGGYWQFGDDSAPEVGMTFFAGTFVRHPLALAAADAVLSHLETNGPDLQKNVDIRAAKLASRLNRLFDTNGVPIHVANFSSIFYLQPSPELKWFSLLFYTLRLHGIHIWEARPFFLSTAHTDDDVEAIVRAFAASIGELQQGGLLPEPPFDKPVGRLLPSQPREEAVLTEEQKEVWLACRMSESASAALNESLTIELHGALQPDALEQAFQEVVNRHSALRTTFSATDGTPSVAANLQVALRHLDLGDTAPADREAHLEEYASAESATPFDLAQGPLIRATLVRLEAERHALVLSAHHIVCDGFSFAVLMRELGALYSAHTEKRDANLAPAPSFSEYAKRQQEASHDETEAYWVNRLSPPPAFLELPTDRPHPPIRTFAGGRIFESISKEQYEALKQFAMREGTTLFTTLLAGFGTMIHRLSGQEDFVVGVPLAGQSVGGAPNMIGHCVHLLPLRLAVPGKATFSQVLKSVWGEMLDAVEQGQVTFGSLLQKLALQRESGRTPLVEVTFNIDRDDTPQNFAGLTVRVEKNPRHYFQFDLGFNLLESENGIRVEASFNRDVFDEATVRRWLGHYKTVLTAAMAQSKAEVSTMPLLTAAERDQILYGLNDTARDFPREKCVHEIFAEQAARTPKAIAVSAEGEFLTYADLDAQSNAVANHLRGLGIRAGTLVGICFERSPQMIVGMLGILKAGAAYVPIDAAYPAERLQFLLDDSGVDVVVTQVSLWENFAHSDVKLVSVEEDTLWNVSTKPFASGANACSPAYVMYTSGSTGQPKGTTIPHRAINRLVLNTDYVSLSPVDVVGQAATVSFDAATFEIWGALLNGARLHILPKDVALSPRRFAETMERESITTLFLTTALFNEIARELPTAFRTLRYVMFGGEACTPRWVAKVKNSAPPQHLMNVYGPTETTTFATWYEVGDIEEDAQTIPIGRPIANTELYVMNERRELVPFGVPGELYIGGDGLALGYHNREELTAEKFIKHSFESGETVRLYRTGDLVRQREDGNIEFLSRLDNQMKVRGFRIEPGEIQAALNQHPAVRESLVTAHKRKDGDKVLVAYVLPRNEQDELPSCQEFRAYLETRLPSYMVPAAYVGVPSFPLNPSGKVNVRALPTPDESCFVGRTGDAAPRNETEEVLATLWQEILGIPRPGIHSNFFALGGHSLLAVRLFAQIETTFGKALPLATLFQASTIAQQAELLNPTPAAKEEGANQIVFTSLMPMQTAGDRPTLYCVHHGYGDLTGYHDLMLHLGTDQPLYGLQALGMNDGEEPLHSIEEMAAHYIREIRVHQPEGPYHITGYSLGGAIAFEMACQLREAGAEVGMVALLDTYAPRFFSGVGDKGLLAGAWSVAATFGQVSAKNRWQYLKEKGRAAQARLKGLFHRSDHAAEDDWHEAIRRVEGASRKALSLYEPRMYGGDLVIFRATEQEISGDYDPVLWWKEVVRGKTRVLDVPGDHHDIIVEPGVRRMARLLRESVDDATK